MKFNKLVQSLTSKYDANNTNFSFSNGKRGFLTNDIVPGNITVTSGKGATLQTSRGEMIDLASMTVNCILGQNDPWVKANMVAYMNSDRPSFVSSTMGSEFYYKVARRILDVSRMKNSVINHRQCNGTDVIELAIKTAYKYRKGSRRKVISFVHSYHGQGLTAYIISDLQKRHQFLVSDSPVIFLDQPDNTTDPMGQKMTQHDNELIEQLIEIKNDIFAVIIEPIQVNNAVNTVSRAFLSKLKTVCEKNNIVLIFDEVQTGFGWLGKMTAAEKYNTWPHIMALSKALTAGFGPLSALISVKKFGEIIPGTGEKTNGSDVRSLVASNAVIDRLIGLPKNEIPDVVDGHLREELEHGLLYYFDSKVSILEALLGDLFNKSAGSIKEIRGAGLIRGICLPNNKSADRIHLSALKHGVFLRKFGSTLIVKPPIVITEEELEKAFGLLRKSFALL